MTKTKLSLIILTLMFLFAFGVAIPNRLFGQFPYLDVLLHFAGGFFIATLIASYYSSEFKKLSQPFAMFVLLGLVSLVGVLWEFFEHTLGFYLADSATDFYNLPIVNFHGDLNDTIQDLLLDILGGIFAWLLFTRRK